jgi:hypothetical chaperone protein
VPSAIYFDLATWHLINTVYNPLRVAELRRMRGFYAEPSSMRACCACSTERLGHDLLARAEAAKIEVSDGGAAPIDLGRVEAGLAVELSSATAHRALDADTERIVAAARATVARPAWPQRHRCALLHRRLDRPAPADRPPGGSIPGGAVVRGDRFASVATGLGLHARRLHGASARNAERTRAGAAAYSTAAIASASARRSAC